MTNYILYLHLVVFLLFSCDKAKGQNNTASEIYNSYGTEISDKNVLSKEGMAKQYKTLKSGDTVAVKFASTINEVCKKKGCWMRLDLTDKDESLVRFKDYGFFVPMNTDNKYVIVEGRAYVTEISVDQLRHYAKDAGKSEAEIEKITKPKITYAFEADGVLIKK